MGRHRQPCRKCGGRRYTIDSPLCLPCREAPQEAKGVIARGHIEAREHNAATLKTLMDFQAHQLAVMESLQVVMAGAHA